MPLPVARLLPALFFGCLTFAGATGIAPPGTIPSAYAEEAGLPEDIAEFRALYMEELRAQRIDGYLISMVRAFTDRPESSVTAWETAVKTVLDVEMLYEAWADKVFSPELYSNIREEMAARKTDAIKAARQSQTDWISLSFDQREAAANEAYAHGATLSEAHRQAITDIAQLMANPDFSEINLELLVQIAAPDWGEENAREQISQFSAELRQQSEQHALATALAIHGQLPEAYALAYRDHLRKPGTRQLLAAASRAQTDAFREAIRLVSQDYRRRLAADAAPATP